MKFWGIFRFEFAYQIHRLHVVLLFAVLAVVGFLNTGDDSLAEALYEDFFLNSPFAVAQTTVIGTLVWLLAAAVVAGGAAARDVDMRMHPLIFTAPISKAEYLGGRFLAAFSLNALILLGLQVGIALAVHAPGVRAESVGPFGWGMHLTSYAIISLPTAFAATALQFWWAGRSGRSVAAYLASFLLFFAGWFVAALLLYAQPLGSLVDPIGIRFVIEDLAHAWTPAERKWRLLALEGTILANRVVWLGVGVGALAASYLSFRVAHRTPKHVSWWRRIIRRPAAGLVPATATCEREATPRLLLPITAQRFGIALQVRQTLAIAQGSWWMVVTGRVGLVLGVAIPILALIVVLSGMEFAGATFTPTTALVIGKLTAPLTAALSGWVMIPLLLVFCAGEMVWMERDAGMGELADTMPTSEWPLLLGRFLAISCVTTLLMVLLSIGGILAQLSLGHRELQPGLYLRTLIGLQGVEYLLFALLAVVVHVLVNQKYVAHLVAIIAYVFIARPSLIGIEHNLLIFGAGPGWSFSELRGFGASLEPWAWFKLYWAAWVALLAVGASLFWARGRDGNPRERLRMAHRRLTRGTVRVATVTLLVLLGCGGFIFYNTNVLNKYFDGSAYATLLAEYEQRYRQYAAVPQPRVAATRLHVEIYPAQREVAIRGTYHLVNRSTSVIDSVHLAVVPGADTRVIRFEPAARAVLTDDRRGHQIHALGRPLQVGDTLLLHFEVRIAERGFGNRGRHEAVVPNGTLFTNAEWLPAIGYQSRRELTRAGDRRTHGLPPRPLIPSIDDPVARVTADERTTLEVVVGTDADQVAVAPGVLRRTWEEGRRRYFHYATDGAIGNDYAFLSARYAVREAQWNDVAIRIYHHPTHASNADRTVASVLASFDQYVREFGPYPYQHLTLVEVRGNEIGMHADPTLIRFSEGIALWGVGEGPQRHDPILSVVAHEMSHQWWGHQLEPAYVEGGPILGESLAEYAAMGVVEAVHGPEQLQRMLARMRQPDPYPPIRRGEALLRGIDPYAAYRRGPFALHALGDRIGRASVHRALRRLLEAHGAGEVPLATTRDLYRELEAVTPDCVRPLLHDLFNANTLWSLAVHRAVAEEVHPGAWRVTLEVDARKVVADTAGAEAARPMDEWVAIGVFGQAEPGRGRLSVPLYLQPHRLRDGRQILTVTVSGRPTLAGIDPHHVLDWEEREDDDNLRTVKLGARGS